MTVQICWLVVRRGVAIRDGSLFLKGQLVNFAAINLTYRCASGLALLTRITVGTLLWRIHPPACPQPLPGGRSWRPKWLGQWFCSLCRPPPRSPCCVVGPSHAQELHPTPWGAASILHSLQGAPPRSGKIVSRLLHLASLFIVMCLNFRHICASKFLSLNLLQASTIRIESVLPRPRLSPTP